MLLTLSTKDVDNLFFIKQKKDAYSAMPHLQASFFVSRGMLFSCTVVIKN